MYKNLSWIKLWYYRIRARLFPSKGTPILYALWNGDLNEVKLEPFILIIRVGVHKLGVRGHFSTYKTSDPERFIWADGDNVNQVYVADMGSRESPCSSREYAINGLCDILMSCFRTEERVGRMRRGIDWAWEPWFKEGRRKELEDFGNAFPQWKNTSDERTMLCFEQEIKRAPKSVRFILHRVEDHKGKVFNPQEHLNKKHTRTGERQEWRLFHKKVKISASEYMDYYFCSLVYPVAHNVVDATIDAMVDFMMEGAAEDA
jgi:hypothetical protein